MVLVVLHANRCGWVGGYWPCANMHPSVRSVQRGHLCPGRAPARARSADEERRPPARGNREPGPLPRAGPAAAMGAWPRPTGGHPAIWSGVRTLAKRATLRPALLRASVLGTYHGRRLTSVRYNTCQLSRFSHWFQLSDQHVSGIESGETQNTRTQHSLVCAQPVDSQSQRLAHAPKVPPHERHRGTQCHGCRPPK